MALKVKHTVIDGQARVDPETMKLLLNFAQHRNLCDDCNEACKAGTGKYCITGALIFQDLLKQPDVEYVPE